MTLNVLREPPPSQPCSVHVSSDVDQSHNCFHVVEATMLREMVEWCQALLVVNLQM